MLQPRKKISSRSTALTRSVSKTAGLAVSVLKNNPTKSNNPTNKSRIIDSPHFLFFFSANVPSEVMYTMTSGVFSAESSPVD